MHGVNVCLDFFCTGSRVEFRECYGLEREECAVIQESYERRNKGTWHGRVGKKEEMMIQERMGNTQIFSSRCLVSGCKTARYVVGNTLGEKKRLLFG